MKHSFIIIDDDPESIVRTLSIATRFQQLHFVGSANTYNDGLNLILENRPTFVFLEIDPISKDSQLSLLLINELHRYLKVIPKIIITSNNKELAIDAIKFGAIDYLAKPIDSNELRKTILLFEKNIEANDFIFPSLKRETAPIADTEKGIAKESVSINEMPVIEALVETHLDEQESEETILPSISNSDEEVISDPIHESDKPQEEISKKVTFTKEDKPLIICVKSYGDYRFIDAKDICYLQADNNSTDIHLINGEMITAFKTLKHFENVLSSPFVRIHNSYIVNIDYVSRIHTGNSVCYIKNTTTKLPFSKSYKENVDAIISSITKGNYLEI